MFQEKIAAFPHFQRVIFACFGLVSCFCFCSKARHQLSLFSFRFMVCWWFIIFNIPAKKLVLNPCLLISIFFNSLLFMSTRFLFYFGSMFVSLFQNTFLTHHLLKSELLHFNFVFHSYFLVLSWTTRLFGWTRGVQLDGAFLWPGLFGSVPFRAQIASWGLLQRSGWQSTIKTRVSRIFK